ncbi:hypothetical protein RU97_GL002214 [Enterococcus canis]|uniref:Multidrug ABC transporter ATP-binding protein n=1 Tax=Enterococcus canis TaxID=214095 RepID=A0A1L8REC8_9ENTE|nr:ABC transporter ATP-binding protein [Enterococcus canis]OJG18141.1 hypothetical protein RU97_GL002214 [Enterococcus canis]
MLKQFYQLHKKESTLTLLFMILQAVGTLLVPYYVAAIIDEGILQGSLSTIWQNGGLMLGVAVLTGLTAIAASYYSAVLAGRFGHFLRNKLIEKIQTLSVTTVDELGTPTLLARTTSDITNLQQIAMMSFQMILPAPLVCLASIILTGMVSWQLIWIPIATILGFSLVALMVIRQATPLAHVMQVKMDQMMQVLRELITGVKVIRAFDKTTFEKERTDQRFTAYATIMIKVNRLFAVLNPTVNLVMGLGMTAILAFGGWLSVSGTIPVGSLTAISEYTILSLWFLTMAAMVIVMIPKALSSYERIQTVIQETPEIKDGARQLQPSSESAIVRFQHVNFSYSGAEEPVLQDLDLTIYRGQTFAIVGGTGSGKSTIAKALLRLKDVTTGRILFHGQDIRTLKQQDLRARISYVPQKAFLFSGTIADNLRYGDQQADLAKMEQVATVAQAADFIHQQPAGFEAAVSQKGSNFSGGQKQRLSIARALMKPADLYFFDDSFSALDYQTDAALRQALKSYLQDAAVVIVAQRLATVMQADHIIVLDQGRIVGAGTHKELMASNAVYQEFARSQGLKGASNEQAS